MSGAPSVRDRRGASRLAAVQALYEMDLAGVSSEAVVESFRGDHWWTGGDEDELIEPDPTLFAELVRGVTARRDEIDTIVRSGLSEDWPFSRLEDVLKAILRAGVFELLARTNVPPRVVISEYVNVTHAFFLEREPGMANAVLDRVARVLRPEEMGVGDT